MEILPGIFIKDLALYLEEHDALVISDLHIGYEEALNKQGILVPRFQFKHISQRLEKILEGNKFDKIIINGDLKHEFGEISEQEWRETILILSLLSKHCKEIIIIRGNHDTILGPITDKKNVALLDNYQIGDILITHGDKITETEKKIIIIGHEHPAISIKEDIRSEKFKCFLLGKYKKKSLIVVPSFNLVTEGADILSEELLSPYLHQDLSNFQVFIVADKVYDFGKIKDL